MKKVNKSLLWSIVLLFALVSKPGAKAQDDLYYDPATDAASPVLQETYIEQNNNNVTQTYQEGYREEDDDYAYEYSSRIRRFHSNSVVVDYYDPLYSDLSNYDPYYAPGSSIYVYNYNDYWAYRSWQNYNQWNTWNVFNFGFAIGWTTWGWSSCYSYNSPWYNPWVANNYYYDPYWTCNGYNPYYHNYYYGNGCGNHYDHCGDYYGGHGDGDGYHYQTYVGPRHGGTHVNPGYARISDSKGRLATAETNVPMVEKSTSRPGRTAIDFDGSTALAPGNTATDRSPATITGGGRHPEITNVLPNGRSLSTETASGGHSAEKQSTAADAGYKPRHPEDIKVKGIETQSVRKDEGSRPRPSDASPSIPKRNETPVRPGGTQGGSVNPRSALSSTSRTGESRPERRSELNSNERPSRTSTSGGEGSTKESRYGNSSERGSSTPHSAGAKSSSGSGGGGGRSSSGSSSGGGASRSSSSGGGSHGGRN